MRKIIIIGGGTAGASAAFAVRKADRTAEITIIEKEGLSTYSRCGLPFAIKGTIQPIENLVVFSTRTFTMQKIDQKLHTEVTQIDTKSHQLTIKDMQTQQTGTLPYDALIFATGSTPSKPSIKGIDGENVFFLRTIEDAYKITAGSITFKSAVIIGASFIGMEVAEALKHFGLDITIIEQKYLLWRMLDKEISAMAKKSAVESGMKLLENMTFSDLSSSKGTMIIISTGVRPNVELAKEAGVEIGKSGGIKTDSNLRTNIPDVYAAGDCAESIMELTGEPVVIGLGTIAARQGVVAGANACGKNKTGPVILGASVLKLLDLETGSVGLTETQATENDKFQPISALIKYSSLPHYYPGGIDVHLKLIADKESQLIIGGQVLCKTGAALRVNMISLLIQNKMTISDLLKSDFCYSPPVADIWDAVVVAAQGIAAKLNRM